MRAGWLDPVSFIENAFCEKRAKNPSYSLRAFSKFLQISPARLSQILSRTRSVTTGQIQKIAVANSLSPHQRSQMLEFIKSSRRKKTSDIKNSGAERGEYVQVDEQIYRVLSDVDTSSILAALVLTKADSKSQIKFLASKLGLKAIEVRRALDSLLASGLVKMETGSYAATNSNIASTSDIRSSALRKFHRDILARATVAIENQDLAERDFSAVSFVLDPSKIEIAKQKIQEFRRDLTGFLEKNGKQSEVYTLNIQLFKLSK